MAAGEAHTCAIRTDSTIACWGNSQDGQSTPHDFSHTSYPERFLAGIHSGPDDCWVSINGLVFDITPGDGGYVYLGEGSLADLCGRDATAEFHRQGLPLPAREHIEGSCRDCLFQAPRQHYTGLGFGRLLDDVQQGEIEPPDGQFTAISASWYHSCGIRDDQTIACWGNNIYKQIDAPGGQYTMVAAGGSHSCAITTDQTVECWGSRSGGPRQTYVTASAEGIALASGATVVCVVVWNAAATGAGAVCSDSQTETVDETAKDDGDTSNETAEDNETAPEEDDTAQRCFAVHQFGAQPVDVAKSADGETVLAQLNWGFHEAIGCYLTLNEAALQTLRAAPPPLGFPAGDPSAAQQCSAVHKFGAQPVDVAKADNRQTVLAQVRWGFHASIGCFLALDTAATAALRAAHT